MFYVPADCEIICPIKIPELELNDKLNAFQQRFQLYFLPFFLYKIKYMKVLH